MSSSSSRWASTIRNRIKSSIEKPTKTPTKKLPYLSDYLKSLPHSKDRKHAGTVCPSLVLVELDYIPTHVMGFPVGDDCDDKPTNVGFVVSSCMGKIEIWAQSFFLYDLDKGKDVRGVRVVRKNSVSVIRQDKDHHGMRYDGIVTFIDFDYNLAIIVVTDPNWSPIQKPSPIRSSLKSDQIVSMDFDWVRTAYTVRNYTLHSHKCGDYYHVDLLLPLSAPGILLDTYHNIVGMKSALCPLAACPQSKQLVHVLPIEVIAARLREQSPSNDQTDIRLRSDDMDNKAKMPVSSSTSFGDYHPAVEEFRSLNTEAIRRGEEADKRAEEADKRAEEAYMRAEMAERRAEFTDRRAQEAFMRAEMAEKRAEETDRRVEEAYMRAKMAESHSEEAIRNMEHQIANLMERFSGSNA